MVTEGTKVTIKVCIVAMTRTSGGLSSRLLGPTQIRSLRGIFFGSAKSQTCNFVFADASVRSIFYHIYTETHRNFGNRFDGIVVGKF